MKLRSRLRLERLESRLAPATLTFNNVFGIGFLTYNAGSDVPNRLNLSYSGGKYTFNELGESISTSISGYSGSGSGTVTGPAADVDFIALNMGTRDDLVTIASVANPTQVNGGAGNDTFDLGPPFGFGGSLDGIDAPVTFNGEANEATPTNSASVTAWGTTISREKPRGDKLRVNDKQGGTGSTYTLSGTTLQRTGMPDASFNTIEELELQPGQGADIINISTTIASALTIVGSSFGHDTVTVATTGASSILDIEGSTLDGINAKTITLQNTGAGSISTVSGSFGNDSITLEGTGTDSGVLIEGLFGEDNVTVRATAVGSVLDINAGDGDDTVTFASATNSLDGLAGYISASGSWDTDTLTFNDSGDGSDNGYSLDGTSFGRSDMGLLSYDTFENLGVGK